MTRTGSPHRIGNSDAGIFEEINVTGSSARSSLPHHRPHFSVPPLVNRGRFAQVTFCCLLLVETTNVIGLEGDSEYPHSRADCAPRKRETESPTSLHVRSQGSIARGSALVLVLAKGAFEIAMPK